VIELYAPAAPAVEMLAGAPSPNDAMPAGTNAALTCSLASAGRFAVRVLFHPKRLVSMSAKSDKHDGRTADRDPMMGFVAAPVLRASIVK
jgi:hypothetical protein